MYSVYSIHAYSVLYKRQIFIENGIRKEEGIHMEYMKMNNGLDIPVNGIGTFLLKPEEAETAVLVHYRMVSD